MKKKIFALFISLSLLFGTIPELVSAAGNNKCGDNLTWTYDNIAQKITIDGTGPMYDFTSYSSLPWYSETNYGENIKEVVIGDNVSSVGSGVFQNCTQLTKVKFGKSIKRIGAEAFQYCRNLSNITLPQRIETIENYAFEDCESVQSLDIPKGILSIGEAAFKGCTALREVKQLNTYTQEKLTMISGSMFEGCTSLESVKIFNSVTNIDNKAFFGCSALKSINLPDKIKRIGEATFADCRELVTVNYPDTIEAVEINAFKNCGKLSNAVLTSRMNVISQESYSGCKALKSIIIPGNVQDVYRCAFSGCTNLTDVTIKSGVKDIRDSVFIDCTNLSNITIEGSLTDIRHDVLKGTAYYNNPANWEDGVLYIDGHIFEANNDVPANYTIKPGTKCSADWAFRYCNNLKSITFPESFTSINKTISASPCETVILPSTVTTIRYAAFAGCDKLKNINLPSGVTSIDREAFRDCQSLETIVIPEGIKEIQEETFAECISLKNVMLPSTIKKIYSNAFLNCNSLKNPRYNGTMDDWSKVRIGIGNESIKNNIKGLPTYKFLDVNGNIIVKKTAPIGTVIEAPESIPTKENTAQYSYTFSGWKGYTKGMILENDITFFPEFTETINNYTYKFLNEDKSVLLQKTVPYGTVIEAPKSIPTKENTAQYSYTFNVWKGYTKGMIIENDITFTPEFTESINNYTYKFLDDDGKIISEKTAPYGTVIEKPLNNPSKVADNDYTYEFNCWDGFSENMVLKNNITFTAKYTPFPRLYTVKFINYDGRVLSDKKLSYGAIITLPAPPTKPTDDTYYYTFDHWDLYKENMTVTGDITFTPVFTKTKLPDYEYEIVDGYAKITKCNVKDENLIIPSQIDGYTVKYIGNKAFYEDKKYRNITIPDSVTEIGENAFTNSSNIESVVIPGSVITIGNGAFMNCPKLNSVKLSEGIKNLGNKVFENCSSLSKIIIPESVITVGSELLINTPIYNNKENWHSGIFYYQGCLLKADNNLIKNNINLELGTRIIATSAFAVCNNLNTITMNDDLDSICDFAFTRCENLSDITFTSDLKYLGKGAFNLCKSLKKIAIPYGIDTIYSMTFNMCSLLTSATIPASVNIIEKDAFKNCNAISEVVYRANEEKWNTVTGEGKDSIASKVTFYDVFELTFYNEDGSILEKSRSPYGRKVSVPFNEPISRNPLLTFDYWDGLTKDTIVDHDMEFYPVFSHEILITKINDAVNGKELIVKYNKTVLNNPATATYFLAVYDDIGNMINVKIIDANKNKETRFDIPKEASSLKLMLWKDIYTLKPLTKEKNIRI